MHKQTGSQLLVIAYRYPPDAASGAARPHRLAKYLERLGYEIDVLAAGRALQPVVDGNVHRLRGGFVRELAKQDATALIERALRRTVFVHDPGGTWAWRVARYAARWMLRDAKPIVFSTAPPATTHLSAYWIKRWYGVRWIADFRDPMAGNSFRPGRVAAFFDQKLERIFFNSADVIIANTDSVGDLWRKRYPMHAGKIHVLWNGFDPEENLEPLPLPERPYRLLAHLGAIYGDRDPNLLLQSCRRLIENGRLDPARYRIRFTGIQPGEFTAGDTVAILQRSGCLELQNAVPKSEAQHLMATSNYLLLLDVVSRSAGLQVPAKLFEYVRIGRPVIATTTPGSPVDRILAQSGLHYTGLYRDMPDETVDAALLDFLNGPTEAVRPSEWFLTTFDARSQAEFLHTLLSPAASMSSLTNSSVP